MQGAVDVVFTPQARARIEAFLRAERDFVPTLTLMKGRVSGETVERWRYGAYAPQNIKHVEPALAEIGRPLLYSVAGFIAAIPQFQFIHELEGAVLGLGEKGSELIVVERRHDG